MNITGPELALIQEALESCQIELDTLVRDREWYVTDVLDLLKSSLEIITTIKERQNGKKKNED